MPRRVVVVGKPAEPVREAPVRGRHESGGPRSGGGRALAAVRPHRSGGKVEGKKTRHRKKGSNKMIVRGRKRGRATT